MEIEIKQKLPNSVIIVDKVFGITVTQKDFMSDKVSKLYIEKQSIPALIEALKKYME